MDIKFSAVYRTCPWCGREYRRLLLSVSPEDPAYKKYGDLCDDCLTEEQKKDMRHIIDHFYADMSDEQFMQYLRRYLVMDNPEQSSRT